MEMISSQTSCDGIENTTLWHDAERITLGRERRRRIKNVNPNVIVIINNGQETL